MKKTAESIKTQKGKNKITMLTAYDSLFSSILDEADIDIVLVGDSVGMVALGYNSTIPVTLDDIIHHTSAAARSVKNSLVVADMPFMTFGISEENTLKNAAALIQKGSADAVKLEGAGSNLKSIEVLVEKGIPVMGHLGLTPQSIKQFGSYKTRGTTQEEAEAIVKDAKKLEEAGAFAIVLEKIPYKLAEFITQSISIPTIGIGAGPFCDGQVLVLYDMLGMFDKFTPKFVKKYAELKPAILEAVTHYKKDVTSGSFPELKHSFDINDEIMNNLKNRK